MVPVTSRRMILTRIWVSKLLPPKNFSGELGGGRLLLRLILPLETNSLFVLLSRFLSIFRNLSRFVLTANVLRCQLPSYIATLPSTAGLLRQGVTASDRLFRSGGARESNEASQISC